MDEEKKENAETNKNEGPIKKKPLNEQIRDSRTEKMLSMQSLANMVHVSSSLICKIEKGEVKTFKSSVARRLSQVLDIPMAEFYIQDNDLEGADSVKRPLAIPIYEKIGCGMPAYGSCDSFESLAIGPDLDPEEMIAIRTKGDSMEPYIYDGDIAVIHIQPQVENGQIAAFRIGQDELLLKILHIETTGFRLESFNKENYPDIHYSWQQISALPVTVIGRLREIVRRY